MNWHWFEGMQSCCRILETMPVLCYKDVLGMYNSEGGKVEHRQLAVGNGRQAKECLPDSIRWRT